MNASMEDDDCAVEAVTPMKKKKMKQARLPFQTLSASKSPSSANSVPNKKRKIISPLEECISPKVIRYTIKENSAKNISKSNGKDIEEKLNTDNENIDTILDEEGEDLEQNDQQDRQRNKKTDTIPKRDSLGKSKKVDKSGKKPGGTLTKFLKKVDKEPENNVNCDNNLYEFKDKQDCQDTSAYDEENEICNESSDAQSQVNVSQVNEKLDNSNVSKNTEDRSLCQESDSDIAILSSDNEISSELDKPIKNRNEERTTSRPAASITLENAEMKKQRKDVTQKQLEKKQGIVRRKVEKARLKMEREKKREEEKANRQRKREEKQKEKEEKERIEKEQKKKEKELKELKKQMEIEQKQKEKEAKEEEKRKKEEERLEAERKKQKAASNFVSFFVPKKQEVKSTEEESVVEATNFMPFEIKAEMRIAPVCRRTLSEHEKLLLEEKCNVGDAKKSELYIEDIKKRRIVPRVSSITWPLEAKDDDIVLLDDDNDGGYNIISDAHNLEIRRPKLLQFGDNRRPPYWGTWRKQSNIINSRRPFMKDKKWFDYEIDSDDEWEEEEPGESLKGSDDEKDEENPEENEYDVDNEFMVPHGYLSDEEARADEEEAEDMSPQTQKMKLKLLGEQFEAERNIKTHKLKPKIIGCIWQELGNTFPESVPTKVKEFLLVRQAWISHIPIILLSSASSEDNIAVSAECKTSTQQQSRRNRKKTKLPHEALPDLIRLVHGNTHGRHFLIKEFITFWSRNDKTDGHQFSKASVLQKINELANWMACPEEGPMHLKSCWYVPRDIRKQYLTDNDLTLPNRWTYILTPNRKSDAQDVADKTEKEEKEKEKEKRNVPLITQFTKKITQKMKKQLVVKSDQVPEIVPKPPPSQKPPKRATLISVGRGEQFPERSRENMLAKFVNPKRKEELSSSEKTIDDSDDIIFVESINKDKKANQKLKSTDKAIKE